MKVLKSGFNPEAYLDKIRSASHRILFLDYDGTLAPFREVRTEAVPYPGVRELLKEIIASKKTRIVIISGRQIDELIPLLGLETGIEIWGSHGREHLTSDGQRHVVEMSEDQRRILRESEQWARANCHEDNVEIKTGCVAIHTRTMPEGAGRHLVEAAELAWKKIAGDTGADIHRFDGGIEIKTPGRDKGFAVRAVLSEYDSPPPCAFYGDDLTDEDAFRELENIGIRVLVRTEFRPTEADIWIQPPEELLDQLTIWKK